jgi:hypothetical protein
VDELLRHRLAPRRGDEPAGARQCASTTS